MLDKTIVTICRQKLISTKADLLNRFQSHFTDFRERDHGGDEADQSMSLMAENQLFATHQRLRQQLLEIENALMRIDKGTFGICEETEELIERDRLMAIPWTRLSIEGAEIRESALTGKRA